MVKLRVAVGVLALGATTMLGGCMVGPNYEPATAATREAWLDASDGTVQGEEVHAEWWKIFNDPVLDRLVATAYLDNLPLRLVAR